MASVRHHVEVAADPEAVWARIRDAGNLADWWPAIERSWMEDGDRHCTLASGITLVEEIVTSDDRLRRFQYRITAGVPVESHLATIDVLGHGEGAIVVYATDVDPPAIAMVLDGAMAEALAELKRQVEDTGGRGT